MKGNGYVFWHQWKEGAHTYPLAPKLYNNNPRFLAKIRRLRRVTINTFRRQESDEKIHPKNHGFYS